MMRRGLVWLLPLAALLDGRFRPRGPVMMISTPTRATKRTGAIIAAVVALAGCVSATAPAAPPADAARLDVTRLSIAAQRFDQFCLGSLNSSGDGVDAAAAFYRKDALPPLGRLKVIVNTDEDVAVQVVAGTKDCRVTTSNDAAPNGAAEVIQIANAFAARNGGTISTSNRPGRATVNSNGRNHALVYGVSGAESGVYFDLAVAR